MRMLYHTFTWIFMAGIMILNQSCEKRGLIRFTLDYEASVVIPSQSLINLPFNILTPDITTNADAAFAVNDTRKDLIKKITLTGLHIELTAPESSDLSFLESLKIMIAAPGMPDQLVAWQDNIPETTGKTLTLNVTQKDLQEYIKKDRFILKTEVVTRKMVTSDHHIDLYSTFRVEAGVRK
jgi:hypothetical protein